MLIHRSPYAHALLLAALLVGTLLGPRTAPATPESATLRKTAALPAAYLPYPDQPVSLVATDAAVPSSGSLDYTAVVRLDEPTDYLQVRIKVWRPSGRLLYQKTFVESDVSAGVRTFRYRRTLDDLDLRPDEYPVELTVWADGEPVREWKVESDLRVYDPATAPLPIALIVKVVSPPQTDPQGRFVIDPALETTARDEVRELADAVLSTPTFKASLAIAPMLLEEWRHVAQGYELAGTGGIVAVAPTDPTSVAYAETLDRLKTALATGRLELLDVPYADPSLPGLQTVRRDADLIAHFDSGRPAYAAAIETTPSSGTYCADALLSTQFAQHAKAAGIRYALVSADCARKDGETTATPGAYRAGAKLDLTTLVPDSALVNGAAESTETLLTSGLFSRAIASRRPSVVPMAMEVGPGGQHSVTTVLPQLEQAALAPWLTCVTARGAADLAASSPVSLVEKLPADRSAPAGFWPDVATAREYAVAYRSACPDEDADAAAAVVDSLIAECAYWAGPDGKWALADRARGFASSAQRRATSVFEKVAITGENVTLAGSTGSVPFSVSNASSKPLEVVITASGPAVRVPYSRAQILPPGDTYLTVPVDLRQAISKPVTLEIVSVSVVVASSTVTVHASYLDRLAIIGAIVLVLVGMLLYISRRVRRAEDRGIG